MFFRFFLVYPISLSTLFSLILLSSMCHDTHWGVVSATKRVVWEMYCSKVCLVGVRIFFLWNKQHRLIYQEEGRLCNFFFSCWTHALMVIIRVSLLLRIIIKVSTVIKIRKQSQTPSRDMRRWYSDIINFLYRIILTPTLCSSSVEYSQRQVWFLYRMYKIK